MKINEILISCASFAVGGFLVAGWFMNIAAIANNHESTGFVILRIIGAIFAPLGGVMGWI